MTTDHLGASSSVEDRFRGALQRFPDGYSRGAYLGRPWSVTVKRSEDSRRIWLFAEDLGGCDIVSFNLYETTTGKALLKPCEMSSSKVIGFVIDFQLEPEAYPADGAA